jgi:hypothetical protein
MAAMRIARSGLGTVYLLAPEWIPGALAVPVDHRARIFVRILGARYVAQAFLVSSAPGRRYALAMGAAVDVIHAASMVALAAVDVRRRRLAMADAGAAVAFAAAGWRRMHRITESDARSG